MIGYYSYTSDESRSTHAQTIGTPSQTPSRALLVFLLSNRLLKSHTVQHMNYLVTTKFSMRVQYKLNKKVIYVIIQFFNTSFPPSRETFFFLFEKSQLIFLSMSNQTKFQLKLTGIYQIFRYHLIYRIVLISIKTEENHTNLTREDEKDGC